MGLGDYRDYGNYVEGLDGQDGRLGRKEIAAMEHERSIMSKILSAGVAPSESRESARRSTGAKHRKTLVADDASDKGKYVSAARNSSVARWFALHAHAAECSKASGAEDMPIPPIGAKDLRYVVALVDEIAAEKADDPDADMLHLEIEIDSLMYRLYGLTYDEYTDLERSMGLLPMTEEEEDAALVRAIEEALAESDERLDISEAEDILREIIEGRN